MVTDFAKIGKRSRTKGGAFERKIAKSIRLFFPDAEVFRTRQSDRAWDSDVTVRAAPAFVCSIWWECSTGASVNVDGKLRQAERDISKLKGQIGQRIPIVIHHQLGSPKVFVSTKLCHLIQLTGAYSCNQFGAGFTSNKMTVRVSLPEFMQILAERIERESDAELRQLRA